MSLFGHHGGQSGPNGGWDYADPSNTWVINQLTPIIEQYANSLGITLDAATLQSVIDKVFPTSARWTGTSDQASSEEQRYKKLEDLKQFILPTLSNIKLNPTVTPDLIAKAGATIQSVLGREATADESAYFAKELAQGKSAYELQQELQSLPEYQKTLAEKDRTALAADLLDQQQIAFQKAIPAIQSQFMKAGRLNSSGLDSAMALAQRDLESQRQGYLGQVGYQDVSNIRNQAYNAFQNYNQQFQQMYNPAGQVQSQYNLLGNAINRTNELSDYQRQKNDYMQFLEQAGQGNSLQGGFSGALNGGMAGGMAGGPWGAVGGGILGGLGGYFANK